MQLTSVNRHHFLKGLWTIPMLNPIISFCTRWNSITKLCATLPVYRREKQTFRQVSAIRGKRKDRATGNTFNAQKYVCSGGFFINNF